MANLYLTYINPKPMQHFEYGPADRLYYAQPIPENIALPRPPVPKQLIQPVSNPKEIKGWHIALAAGCIVIIILGVKAWSDALDSKRDKREHL
jgi:hypothetical protein